MHAYENVTYYAYECDSILNHSEYKGIPKAKKVTCCACNKDVHKFNKHIETISFDNMNINHICNYEYKLS